MEITEIIPAMKSATTTCQSDWLRDTLSGNKLSYLHESLLNNNPFIPNLSTTPTSYCILATKYDKLKSVLSRAYASRSSSTSNKRSDIDGLEHADALESWDDYQWEAIGSNPIEAGDDECNRTNQTFEDLETFSDNKIKPEKTGLGMEKFRMSKLVEENTRLQVELIRRNNEKREAIRKLKNQVNRLMEENDALHHRHGRHVEANQPKRKSILLDKFFRGCS